MEVIYAISDFGNPAFASISITVAFFLWAEKIPVFVRIMLAGILGAAISRGPVVYSRISDFGNDAEIIFASLHFALYLPLSFLAAWLVTWLLSRKFLERTDVFQ